MLKKILTAFSGNYFWQNRIEKNILFSMNLMGIGSGAGVQNSGEKSVLKLLAPSAQPYCIFDVGANKGQYLNIALTQLSGKKHIIHSFEPCKKTFNLLKENFPLSENIILNNFRLGK